MNRRRRAVRLGLPLVAPGLIGAAAPETRIAVTLPPRLAAQAGGRLLIFAQQAASPAADPASVDLGAPDVSVAARDVASFGPARSATIDTRAAAYPQDFAALPPGDDRIQAVLDRHGDYNYAGRNAGDLVSPVTMVHLPLTGVPAIALDHAVPPARDQFDTTGLPPVAAAQIATSRPHLHDESVASPLLSRFHRSPRANRAWVLTPPNYDPKAHTTYPTVYTGGAFGTNHRIDGQQLSRQWHLMETGAIPPMIWVTLDFAGPSGTTELADSANNGPWGEALVREVIPVTVGTADSYYLDGSIRQLEAAFRKVGGHADFTYVPGDTHSINEVYTRAGDRNAGWKEMTRAMLAIARPHAAARTTN